MTERCNRPLESVYPVVFIDAIVVKVRDGQVTNRHIQVAIGVTCAGDGGEGAKFWLSVLSGIKLAAPLMCASWSTTDSKDCRTRSTRCGRGRLSRPV